VEEWGFVDRKPLVGSGTILAGVVIALLYATNLVYCQRSALRVLDAAAVSSDMHANLMWAKSVEEQGWLNPQPYHPWNDWMQSVAPYAQWVSWWGDEKIFQQSPLYAYLLSLFMHKYFGMRVLQALMSITTCVFIALFTGKIAGRTAGWIAFWLAALYAPFYLYSWPFLRDGLGWLLLAASMWALAELGESNWEEPDVWRKALLAGILLGLGFLAKETFQLLIPAIVVALANLAWKRKSGWKVVASVAAAAALAASPLILRNAMVGAPLLSSSNRFAETFIHGNAGSSSSYLAVIPSELGKIMHESDGKTLAMIRATIASHETGVRGWMWLQVLKLRSLLDPFESPDNLSFYFVAHISPVVRFGLRYWMILPAALAGLLLGIWQRERTHFWIWVFVPISLASMLVGIPLSRYRQSLMVMLIPCAAYFLAILYDWVRRREFGKACYASAALLVGWLLMLGPLARQPRRQYERASEYLVSAQIYERLGDEKKAREMMDVVRQRFPGLAK
jgi:4-amino-4-deoxy-L-arabinose transferase-like glycosyltransferase